MIGMNWSVLAELKKIAKYKIGMYCIVLACIVQYTPLYIQIPVNTYQTYQIHTNSYQYTAQIETKMLHLPKPRPRVWIQVVPVSSLLGCLPLIPAGDTGTVPHGVAELPVHTWTQTQIQCWNCCQSWSQSRLETDSARESLGRHGGTAA